MLHALTIALWIRYTRFVWWNYEDVTTDVSMFLTNDYTAMKGTFDANKSSGLLDA